MNGVNDVLKTLEDADITFKTLSLRRNLMSLSRLGLLKMIEMSTEAEEEVTLIQ